jgi:hypothetical protein
MGAQVPKSTDVEQDRQQRLEELREDYGLDWVGQYKPGSFGCHELLDRTAMAVDLVESQLLSHPACAQNAEWYALAEQAFSALHNLYQKIGEAHLDVENETPS